MLAARVRLLAAYGFDIDENGDGGKHPPLYIFEMKCDGFQYA